MALFRPKKILPIFTDFDAKYYKERGFDTVFLDIDNTIAVPDTGTCDERAEQFINNLRTNGFRVLIFSNNNLERVKMFIRDIDADIWFWAGKPLPFAYWLACLKMKTKPSKTIVMGDQLLTDILGANLSGCYGIYCRQLQEEDTPVTARNRKIEKIIWKRILHEEM